MELIPALNASVTEPLQIVTFRVGREYFGLDILRVQEIIRHQRLTRLPNAPEFVAGVIHLRGKVVPVIALRTRFGLEPDSSNTQARIVALEIHETLLGLLVDSVPEVLRVEADAVVAPPRFTAAERDYLSGMAKLEDRLVLLLDVDQIVSDHEADTRLVAHG